MMSGIWFHQCPCYAGTDAMWTDKYAPCRASEVIGNWASCKRLRDWLTQWKEMISRIENASKRSSTKQRGRRDSTGKADGIFVLDLSVFI